MYYDIGGVIIKIIDMQEVNCMLLQFRFKNYKSFKEEVVFSMVASPIKDNRCTLLCENKINILPVSAVFGANASGKSNFFSALDCMLKVIQKIFNGSANSFTKENKLFTIPFFFAGVTNDISESVENPTLFELILDIEGTAYRYGFTCSQKKLISEWLYKQKVSKNVTQEKLLYKYNYLTGEKGESQASNDLKKEINFCKSMSSENSLLINTIGLRGKNNEIAFLYAMICTITVLDFNYTNGMILGFYNQIIGEYFENEHDVEMIKYYLESNKKDYKNMLISSVHEIDPAITDIEVSTSKNSEGSNIYTLYSIHQIEDRRCRVPFDLESEGTKKYLIVLTYVMFSLSLGFPLFIDELDSSLHPLLLRKIIGFYTDKSINRNNAQLIFSSHNTVSLDNNDLRRDEIWFIEKVNQISSLYSLYDFNEEDTKIRSDISYSKNYLTGRFGAIPFQH